MRRLIAHIAVALTCLTGWSQTELVSVDVKASQDTLKLGDQMELTLSVRYPNELEGKMQTPDLESGMKGASELLDVLNESTQTDPENASFQIFQQRLLVTNFDTLSAQFGPFFVMADTTRIYSDSLMVAVVVPGDSSLADIMDAQGVELTAEEQRKLFYEKNLWWMIALAAAILIAIGIYIYMKRKGQREEPEVVVPAHVTALRELKTLREEDEKSRMLDKPFYTRLTNIFRNYLAGRYDIRATEQTTEQIMASLRFSSFPSELQMQLREILNIADEVKFAKGQSDDFTRQNALKRVEEMIHNTKPEEEVEPRA